MISLFGVLLAFYTTRFITHRVEFSWSEKDYYCRVLIYIASSMLCTTENWNNVDVL